MAIIIDHIKIYILSISCEVMAGGIQDLYILSISCEVMAGGIQDLIDD